MRCSTRQAVGAFLGLLVGAASLAAPISARAATPGVPFTDPAASGSIGLCNRAGQQLTHGRVGAQPFVWRAVSTQAAAAPYNAPGRTAALYAYQPLQVLSPGDWSGAQLTASTRYANAAHPTAVATATDGSLANFIGQFQPKWDGLLQLRMFLGARNQPTQSLTYPATTIKVTGSTWHVVGPIADVSCHSGAAVSIETLLLPPSATTSHHKHGAHATQAPSATPSPVTPAPGNKTTPAVQATIAAAAAASVSSSSSSGGGHGALIFGVAVAVLVLAVIGFLAVRRRGRSMTGSG